LIEKSKPHGKIANFDGFSEVPKEKVTVTKFGLAYARLFGAATNPESQLPNPKSFLGKPAKSGEIIPLKILFFDYHQLKKTALADGEVSISNNQIHNVLGRNPLEKHQMFMSVPWCNKTLQGNSFSFRLQTPLTNRSDVQTIEIDFGDGKGFQALKPEQVTNVIYAKSETCLLTTRILLNNGQKVYSQSEVTVELPTTGDRGYTTGFDIPINGATVTGLSSCGDMTICKPLIVVEGFNAPLIGEENYDDFIGNLGYFSSATFSRLIKEFELSSYDIVYVDFDDGTASLEDNAEVVKSVIRKINEMKAASGCSQPNIVWGESMGGVLSKLALHEMEHDGEVHDCEKLITFDSPLRGANVPLGFQVFMDHLANSIQGSGDNAAPLKDFIPELADAENTLLSGAAKDMLIYHYKYVGTPSNRSPSFTALYQKLKDFGALAHCEHVAISNGSQRSFNQGYPANGRLLKIEGEIDEILDDCAGFSGFWGNITEFVLDFFFDTEADIDIEIRALPDLTQGVQMIYHGAIFIEIYGANIIDLPELTINIADTQPIDNSPGGWIDYAQGTTSPCSIATLDQTRFCFVPAVSAIEVGPFVGTNVPFSDPFADISNNATVLSSGLTSVDRFLAWDDPTSTSLPSTFNQSHLAFSTDNTAVLLFETRGILPPSNILNNRIFNYGKSTQINIDYSTAIQYPFPFGKTQNTLNGGLTIENTGKIWINHSGKIGYTDVSNSPIATQNSIFDVYMDVNCDGNNITTVRNNGRIEIGDWVSGANNIGNLIIGSNNQLVVDDAGILEINDNSSLVLKSNSIVHVKKGGTLKINSSNGIIKVLTGGTLILDEGAFVRLNNSEAKIRIEGTLQINGDIDFSGTGYFEFAVGNELTFGDDATGFKLVGQGTRFIKLDEGAALEIPKKYNIDLFNGDVQYSGGSTIIMNQRCKGTFGSVNFFAKESGGDIGLQGYNMSNLWVENCTFDQIAILGIIEGSFGPATTFSYTKFTNYDVGLLIKRRYIANFNECHWSGYGTDDGFGNNWGIAPYGLRSENTAHVVLRESTIEGHNTEPSNLSTKIDQNPLAANLGVRSAIEIEGGNLYMYGGELRDNDYGIQNRGFFDSPSTGFPANILLSKNATIRDGVVGICMKGNNTRGLVQMNCARIINQRFCIAGEDIRLMIDPTMMQTGDLGASNTFIIKKSPSNSYRFLWVVYTLMVTVPPPAILPATSNFWAEQSGSGNLTVLTPTAATLGSTFFNVLLFNANVPVFLGINTTGAVPEPPKDCKSNGKYECEDPSGIKCFGECTFEFEAFYPTTVKKHYLKGTEKLAIEEYENARDLFHETGGADDGEKFNTKDVCKSYKLAAISLSEQEQLEGEGLQSGRPSERSNEQLDPKFAHMYPNPSSEQVEISLPIENAYNVTIFNTFGQIVKSYSSALESIKLDVSSWNSGIYTLEIEATDHKTRRQQLKMLVQH
jgi:hypothetical protein